MRKLIIGLVAALAVVVPVSIAPAVSASTVNVSAQRDFSETRAQQQARLKALDYLSVAHFSRKGLIKQLRYEGFTYLQAVYGVDHIRVSWYRQAYLKAKDYLSVSHFSRASLIGQLRYEGFTYSQAVYGVNKVGL